MKEMTPNELIEYSNNSKCILIDVRTEREWETVGKPDGDQIGLKTYFVSIKNNEGSLNGNFVNDILSLNIEKEFEIAFICKSGVRSALASDMLSHENYKCINVVDGFEGNEGWLNAGLPVKK
ncbi:MAG: rhodanese-like domain-containing protein [Candidatus Pelagibacterales bacterium]